ncbi:MULTISPECIES: o-succinylbenzoate synthase [unclassified Microcoleus]|uniref:o-succinylbenzoate synthase n=1 Tax=unclassified Microcoleus TaxID=2642155 RepID=UPI002FD0F46E
MLYQFEFRTYQRKFKRPLLTSHGIWDIRSGIILRLVDENGRIGWGEIAPLSWFGSETFEQALDFCHQLPANISLEMIFAISAELPACQFGFESALSNEQNSPPPSPPCQGGEKSENLSQYSGLLPAGETALQVLPMLWLEGHRTFKWKIGVAAIEEELTIFQQLIASMDDLCDRQTALLRLDANGGLTYSEAQKWLEACDRVTATPDLATDIEFLEQPLPIAQFQEMVELNAIYATDLALDESAANLDRIQECYSQGWRGIFVIKPAIGGSPSQLRKFCQTHNIDAVFSSVFETKIGRQAALNLATELSLNNRALGFGTDSWFDDNQDTWLKHLWQNKSQ